MDRLLVVIAFDRPRGTWHSRDAVIAASPGIAAELHERNGGLLFAWPSWPHVVALPQEPGLWVWEGTLALHAGRLAIETTTWREPTVYELEAVVQGANPWAPRPALLCLPDRGNVAGPPVPHSLLEERPADAAARMVREFHQVARGVPDHVPLAGELAMAAAILDTYGVEAWGLVAEAVCAMRRRRQQRQDLPAAQPTSFLYLRPYLYASAAFLYLRPFVTGPDAPRPA
jgi:hypothetical protein